MKKSWIISTVAAATLIFTGGMSQADAADVKVQSKVYTYQVNNINEIQSYLQNILGQYGIDWNKVQWNTPTQKEAPKAEAPKAEAPKAETPAAPAPAPAPQPAEKPAEKPVTNDTSSVSAFEKQVVELTNQYRAQNGLAPLKLDTELSKVAKDKSLDMQKNGYFSHTSPTYGSPFDMMRNYGIQYRTAGENIAMGQRSPEEVVQAWMNSEGHRANILNANFTHIGVGHVESGNYWTQMFIGK